VLYRSHFHALELQLELTRRNIPFTITSGIRFFEQAHIKDVTAFIKLLNNPADEISFKRMVRLLAGIGNKGADKLWSCFETNLRDTPEETKSRIATVLQRCVFAVPKKAAVAWAQLTATFAQIEAEDIRHKPAEVIRLLVEALYEDYAEENFANYSIRLDELEQLANYAQGFTDTNEFLTQLALLSNLEADDEKPRTEDDDETLKLTTIHQAKGLEFTVVFLIMLCDGMFPSARSIENEDAIEEERRLFYVGITRAKRELYLSYPVIRVTQGYGNNAFQQQSRFLKELPPELLDSWSIRQSNPWSARLDFPSSTAPDEEEPF